MIEIQLKTAILLYAGILVTVFVLIWVYTEITTRRAYRVLTKQFLWRCVFCGYSYLDENAESISQCPRCQSFNSAADSGAKEIRPRPRSDERDEAPLSSDLTHPTRNPSRRKRPVGRHRGGRRRR